MMLPSLARALSLCLAPLLFSSMPAFASFLECGKASWYELRGKTASGAEANPDGLFAAHRTLPFGTKVLVRNIANKAEVVVIINDRGPFVKGRVIDVTREAARQLGFLSDGITQVEIRPQTTVPTEQRDAYVCSSSK